MQKVTFDLRIPNDPFSQSATHIKIFLESSKTDQYRDGSVVVITWMDTEYCPVAMLERYMRLASISIEKASDKFLFSDIVLSCSSYIETTKILCGQLNARCTTCRRFD